MNNLLKNIMLSVFVIAVASSVLVLFKSNSEFKKKITEFEDELSRQQKDIDTIHENNKKLKDGLLAYFTEMENKEGAVNLTSDGLQDIGKGFTVGKIELKQHLTGVKVSGIVINSTSLNHSGVTFRIKIANSVQSFTVNEINSGASSPFSAYIPDIKLEETNFGNISYDNSTVSYKRF